MSQIFRRSFHVALLFVCLLSLPGCFSAPPQIIAVDPDRGSVGVAANSPITVHFDREIVRASIPSRFSVTPSIGCNPRAAFSASSGADCYVEWLSGQPGFTFFHPGAIFAPNAKYVFHLANGIASTDGTVNSLNHDWDVTTAQAPTVSSTTPADQATNVPVDSPIAVAFSRAMNPANARKSITLSPPVADARVVPNSHDPTRFVLVPGELLRANQAYTLSITRKARGLDGQSLALSVTTHFRTGSSLTPGAHGIAVLQDSRGATSVNFIPLTRDNPADNPSVARLLGPSRGWRYSDAVISPTGQAFATVETDLVNGTQRIAVYSLRSSTPMFSIPNATLPCWSASGDLAFVETGGVGIVNGVTGSAQHLTLSSVPEARPQWTSNEQLVLTTEVNGARTAELADVTSQTVYQIPEMPKLAAAPLVSNDVIVGQDASRKTVSVFDMGSPAGVRQLKSSLLPIGFTSGDAVFARSNSTLFHMSLSDGSTYPISGGPPSSVLTTVQAIPGGRQMAWVSGTAQRQQLMICNADGSGAIALTADGLDMSVISLQFA